MELFLQHKYFTLVFVLCTINLSAQYNFQAETAQLVEIYNESSINSDNLEFSPFYYRDFIGFVYSNPKSKRDQEISEHYFDLGFSAKGTSNELLKRALFNKNINSKFHEGPACFDHTKGNLYFTRTYYDEDKLKVRDTIVRKIYQASERLDFKDAKPLKINSEKYSTCHPSIIETGEQLIFSSNRESTLGKMDIFSAEKKGKYWETVKNIKEINSNFNEIFPFYAKDDLVFFASDRPGGLGGLDIYYTSLIDSSWTAPIPLPYPFNSSYDDFGLILDSELKSGYFSSSRPGGIGKDDIYSFQLDIPLLEYSVPKKDIYTKFYAMDKLNLSPISGAVFSISKISFENDKYELENFDLDVLSQSSNGEILLKLYPKGTTLADSLVTNNMGQVEIMLKENTKYLVRIRSNEYEESIFLFEPSSNQDIQNVILNPIPVEVEPVVEVKKDTSIYIPTTVGEVVVFNNIYYEFNSSKIQEGAAEELDVLAKVMLRKTTMVIELSAHTDSKGDPDYNQQLSIQRAISARDYLVSKGINPNRIKALGFGETRIRNHCIDGVKCTDEEHKYNRRTEVKVLSE